jgi:hypothetical protein
LGGLVATAALTGFVGEVAADCPWIVQPHLEASGGSADKTLVNIVYDGLVSEEQHFYGFTVTDIDLAWQLAGQETLPKLGPHGRPLMTKETEFGQAFGVDVETIKPHTVYLVAARAPVDDLEDMQAAITPSLPFAVSQYITRGATDVTGPMPTMSLLGVEIRAFSSESDVDRWLSLRAQDMQTPSDGADGEEKTETVVAARDDSGDRNDVQICAYQVAMR